MDVRSVYVVSENLGKAGHTDIRLQNRALVLRTLAAQQGLSRSDLARATGLTRMAISEIVASLIEDSLIVESGRQVTSSRGRKGTLLSLNSEGYTIVAIDLSQPHHLFGALADLAGSIVVRQECPIGSDGQLAVELLTEFCRGLIAQAKAPVLGIGVAAPGIVSNDGVVLTSTPLGWKNLDLASLLREQTGLPVYVHHDVDSAALAEKQFGSIDSDLLFVHVTRGVGLGVVIGDQMVSGANSAAGEIGHVVVEEDGQLCVCGKRGCLETLISATVLERAIARDVEHTADILIAAGRILGKALSTLVGVLDMSYVAVYGPPTIVTDDLIEATAQTLNDYVRVDFRQPVLVRRSQIGDDIILKGEIAAVLRSQLGM